MNRLLPYFRGYYFPSIVGPLLKLIEVAAELSVPLLVAELIDKALPTKQQSVVIQYTLWMIAVAFIGVVATLTAQYFAARAAIGITQALSRDAFKHTLSLPKKTRDLLTADSLTTRLTNDTHHVQVGLNFVFRLLIRSPFIVVGASLMAWRIDAALACYFFAMTALLFLVVGVLTYILTPYQKRVRQQLERLVSLTREQLQGMRVIRAFNQATHEQQQFEQANQHYTSTQKILGYLTALSNPLTFIIVNMILVLVLWQGGQRIQVGSLTQGEIVALVNYLLQILSELLKIVMVLLVANKAAVSAQRVFEIMDAPSEDLTAVIEQKGTDFFAFDQVSFSYGQQEMAVSNVTFSIPHGATIGMIGGTGSGKTTVIQLLARLYEATSGQIHINARVPQLTTQLLRDCIGIVPQKAELFKGTIRSNLLLSNPNATDAQLWQVLEIAQATDFVQDLSEEVLAFGSNFSGGQKQRLTIARALVKPIQLLILDDATSALDMLTEQQLLEAIRTHYPQVTLLIVSQRTRSLAHADNILVLEDGQQVGFDSHTKLLETCAVYQEIHATQIQLQEVSHD
ncbi:MAG: ABC transporter ATP-binding protein [Aerococcaceae bacterium]|nr:ABC transporter ATP-binding protein [Aerococcaceae bacterium]